ncbi:MAG: hypothetical protein V4850_07285 [Myxococcota bacterium]
MRMVLVPLLLAACKGQPLDAPWCADEDTGAAPTSAASTWWTDIAPIVEQKCLGCHDADAHAPLTFETYAQVASAQALVRDAVIDRRMPPWLAAECCTPWFQDFGLTELERATLIDWIDAGAPEGDPADAGEPRPPIGGVSRVDLTLTMPEPYTPDPPDGTIDENRCFLLDWPVEEEVRITGMAPRPGARDVVHHLIVASVGEADVAAIERRDAEDDGAGFDCSGGMGEFPTATPLGGSLLGGDYPRGIGSVVSPDSRILLQIHYSASSDDPPADQTSLDFRLDTTAVDARSIVVGNAAWLVGEAMRVPAGEEDVGFWYRFQPLLFTGGQPVDLQGVTPHMHRYASRMRVVAVKPDGSTTCLLEIPRWDFGWEQPYWFDAPIRFEPEDEVYIECRFDNSVANQPDGQEPREIAWGDNDQDMCAAFISFTDVEQ